MIAAGFQIRSQYIFALLLLHKTPSSLSYSATMLYIYQMETYEQIEQSFTCPYCWQSISILLDLSVQAQSFVEDCEVCCHPIQFKYAVEDGNLTEFDVIKLQ
jgi:hypothetical protein